MLNLGYHVSQGWCAEDTTEHLITQVIPQHLAQVHIDRRGYQRQGEQPPLPLRQPLFVRVKSLPRLTAAN